MRTLGLLTHSPETTTTMTLSLSLSLATRAEIALPSPSMITLTYLGGKCSVLDGQTCVRGGEGRGEEGTRRRRGMISSVAVRAHGRERGGRGRHALEGVIKSRYPRKRQKETEQLRCCGRGESRLSPVPLQPNRKTLRSCYTFAEESSCAFPNTRCDAQAPAQIFLLGKQASLAAAAAAARGGGGGLHSLYFICIPSHRNPAAEEEEEEEGGYATSREKENP